MTVNVIEFNTINKDLFIKVSPEIWEKISEFLNSEMDLYFKSQPEYTKVLTNYKDIQLGDIVKDRNGCGYGICTEKKEYINEYQQILPGEVFTGYRTAPVQSSKYSFPKPYLNPVVISGFIFYNNHSNSILGNVSIDFEFSRRK